MNALKLKQMLTAGPLAVEFKKRVEDFEGYAEAGMRAHLKALNHRDDDEVSLEFDYSAFDEHNKLLESANYYDKNQQPTLTAREAGYYTGGDDFYVTTEQDTDLIFTVLSDSQSALIQEFTASNAGSYVQWLEQQLLAARGQV